MLLFQSPPIDRSAELEIHIELSRPNAGGMMRIALCPGREAYDELKGCHSQSTSAETSLVRAVFTDLQPGEFAIKALHDVNGNGDMDLNLIGLPKEPYGFSNDVMGAFGPPDFDEAKIVLKSGKNAVRLRMRN